jgi:hypothetical protein
MTDVKQVSVISTYNAESKQLNDSAEKTFKEIFYTSKAVTAALMALGAILLATCPASFFVFAGYAANHTWSIAIGAGVVSLISGLASYHLFSKAQHRQQYREIFDNVIAYQLGVKLPRQEDLDIYTHDPANQRLYAELTQLTTHQKRTTTCGQALLMTAYDYDKLPMELRSTELPSTEELLQAYDLLNQVMKSR